MTGCNRYKKLPIKTEKYKKKKTDVDYLKFECELQMSSDPFLKSVNDGKINIVFKRCDQVDRLSLLSFFLSPFWPNKFMLISCIVSTRAYWEL